MLKALSAHLRVCSPVSSYSIHLYTAYSFPAWYTPIPTTHTRARTLSPHTHSYVVSTYVRSKEINCKKVKRAESTTTSNISFTYTRIRSIPCGNTSPTSTTLPTLPPTHTVTCSATLCDTESPQSTSLGHSQPLHSELPLTVPTEANPTTLTDHFPLTSMTTQLLQWLAFKI